MKLTYRQTATFCRALALLLHAGIGLAEGMFLLCEEESGDMKTLLEKLGNRMNGGMTFSQAMEQTGAFPACVIGMVYVGEQTGRMEDVLESLGHFYEQREQNSRRIIQMLTYPSLIMVLMLIVVGVLLVEVLPIFDEVYSSLGSHLTGAGAGLLGLGRILKRLLPVFFCVLVVLAAVLLLYRYYRPVREKVCVWVSARFGDRGFLRKFNNAQFAQALAMGIGSGLPLEDAVEQSGRLLADVPGAAQRSSRCAAALRDGSPLAAAMGEHGFLAPGESRMLSIGLREGSADRVMLEIARYLMEDADAALEETIAKIEPAMVLGASVLVGLILLSVMLPLMDIMASIG